MIIIKAWIGDRTTGLLFLLIKLYTLAQDAEQKAMSFALSFTYNLIQNIQT